MMLLRNAQESLFFLCGNQNGGYGGRLCGLHFPYWKLRREEFETKSLCKENCKVHKIS